MAGTQMKSISASLVIWKMQMKTTIEILLYSSYEKKKTRPIIQSAIEDVSQLEVSYTGRSIN